MVIIFEIIGGPCDGGFVSYDVHPEMLSEMHHAECDCNTYMVQDIDLQKGTGKLVLEG